MHNKLHVNFSFLHAHFIETVNSKVVENWYVVGTHWNCLFEAIPMCTNNIYFTGNKDNYFEIYTYQVLKVCPFSIHFKDLKLSISIKE